MLVLLGQLAPAPGDAERNAELICEAVAGNRGADLAVFPELFLSGYEAAVSGGLAMDDDHVALRMVRDVAANHATSVVVGFPERLPDGRAANAFGCATESGKWVTAYRKTHLFGPRERAAFVAGERLALVRLRDHRIGPLICFDMEFPEPARALAVAGAEVLVTIAANMEPYGPDHQLAARARALDNRRPHVYVNRAGSEGDLRFVGGSMVVAADGSVVTELGDGSEVVTVEVALTSPDPLVDYVAQGRSLEVEQVVAG